MKWETLELRTQLWSCRELPRHIGLIKSPGHSIRKTTRPFLEASYDHTVHAVDILKTNQATATSFPDVHISILNQSANKVM